MGFYDFHIHTKYSGCCKGDYNYSDVWKKIKNSNLDGFGVSDHCNYPSYKPEFILEQKYLQKKNKLEKNGLVGLEISIYNKKGDLGISKKYLDLIDYKIVSEHIHISKLFSGFFTTKAKVKKWLKNYKNNADKIDNEISRVLDTELKAINRFPKSIFAHIFRFPLNVRYVSSVLIDRLDEILDALQTNKYAFEIHSSHYSTLNKSDEEVKEWKVAGDFSNKELYQIIYKRLKDYSIPFALGSDAHNLNSIKDRNEWSQFLKKMNIRESQLITPEFFLS